MWPADGPKPPLRRRDGRRGYLARAAVPRRERPGATPIRLALLVGLALTAAHVLRSSSLSLSGPAGASDGLSALLGLYGDVNPLLQTARDRAQPDATPKLIPRIIHQTFKDRNVPPQARQYMRTWRSMNPGWEIRFYDDAACLEFVRTEFPEYLAAYKALERDVERSDFFRYMVVLRHGGVYADIDTEVRQPLDSVLEPFDTLVVGWESDFVDAKAAVNAWYVRPRQIVQWVFAGAPGHPALRSVCDRVAAQARRRFSLDASIDTLERTGPGAFTDAVLAAARAVPWSAARSDPWRVRILPRVAFGAPRSPKWGLTPRDPGVVVQHHFLGSWRGRRRWPWQRSPRELARAVAARFISRPGAASAAEMAAVEAMPESRAARLYPTSAAFDPPFVVMAPRGGQGDAQSGADVAASIAAHGAWQPSVQPLRGPSLAEALVGSMGRGAGAGATPGVLVDVGAGYGFLSLAAAARGHRAHAFETAPRSAAALRASLAYNGFESSVTLHADVLGADPESTVDEVVCLGGSGDVDVGRQRFNASKSRKVRAGAESLSSSETIQRVQSPDDVERMRGYGPRSLYAASAAHSTTSSTTAAAPSAPAPCPGRLARRVTLLDALPRGERVDALRVSANGWEAAILGGAMPLLRGPAPPPVIALEWSPAAMRAAGVADPIAAILEPLRALGYDEVSHSGYVCDERWYAATYGVRRRGGVAPEELAALRQPTWCRLRAEDWPLLLGHGARPSAAAPETLLFVNRAAGQARRQRFMDGANVTDATAEALRSDARSEVAGGEAGDNVGASSTPVDVGNSRTDAVVADAVVAEHVAAATALEGAQQQTKERVSIAKEEDAAVHATAVAVADLDKHSQQR